MEEAEISEKDRPKHREQRAQRGWSDCDWWSGDTFLAKVIGEMTAKYRDDGVGYPAGMTVEEWSSILTRISEPLIAYANDKFNVSTNAEEVALSTAAQDALRLFADHFPSFWD